MDAAELEEIHQHIRKTDMESAQADIRLARYHKTADQIRLKIQSHPNPPAISLRDSGVPPGSALLTPEEIETFHFMLSQIGITLPDFLLQGLSLRQEETAVTDARAMPEAPRKKRVKFHL